MYILGLSTHLGQNNIKGVLRDREMANKLVLVLMLENFAFW